MSDTKSPDSDYFLTKEADADQSLEHLPPSAILLRARLAAIESGRHQVVINNLDEIVFEGLPMSFEYVVFKPTGQILVPAYWDECGRKIENGTWELFYTINRDNEQ